MARKVTTADLDVKTPTERPTRVGEPSDRQENEGPKKQPDGHRAKARLVAE